jgi:hypothetical protein
MVPSGRQLKTAARLRSKAGDTLFPIEARSQAAIE